MDDREQITSGEIWRRLQDVIRDLGSNYVKKQVYDAHRQMDHGRVRDLELRVTAAEAKSQFYFRLILTSLIFPTVILLVALYVQSLGGS